VVLAALGKEIGRKIEPRGSVKDDYFLIHFDEVPVQEAIDKIAETLNATWSQKDGVLFLDRTRKQEREEQNQILEDFKASLDDWADSRKPEGEYTVEFASQKLEKTLELIKKNDPANFQRLITHDQQTPFARFLTRFVGEVDSELVANLQPGDSVQFARTPNASQFGLESSRALQILERENSAHIQALEKTQAEARSEGGQIGSRFISPYRRQLPDLAKLKVTFIREEFGTRAEVTCGRLISSAYGIIPLGAAAPEAVPQALMNLKSDFEWSEPMQSVMAAGNAWGLFSGALTPAEIDFLPEFSDPVENDVLGLLGSNWIIATAKALDQSAVCLLADEMAFIPVVAAMQEMPLGQLWGMVASPELGAKVSSEDGWLTVTPVRPSESRHDRFDRQILRDFIRQHKKEDSLTIDSLSKLAACSGNDIYFMFTSFLAGYATEDPGLVGISGSLDLGALRLYASLDEAQKLQAHRGGTTVGIPHSTNPEFNRYARLLAFSSRMGFESSPRTDIWNDSHGARVLGSSRDAFDALGGGIPQGSSAMIQVVDGMRIYYKRKAGPPGTGTVDTIAMRIASAEKNQQTRESDFREFFIGPAQRLFVQLSFPEAGYVSGAYQIDQAPKDAAYTSIDGLPGEFRDELKKQLQYYRGVYNDPPR
jgi:hypothetical protein